MVDPGGLERVPMGRISLLPYFIQRPEQSLNLSKTVLMVDMSEEGSAVNIRTMSAKREERNS